jgi:DNA-directed RNA polymerase subunit H (RpoH/RPB5)
MSEIYNISRTYDNISKYLGKYYINVTEKSRDAIKQSLTISNYVDIRAYDKDRKIDIIYCIIKHDLMVSRINKLIEECTLSLGLHTSLKSNTDIFFVVYDTDLEDKYVKKHNKNIKKIEDEMRSRDKYQNLNINLKYYSYNIFKFTLEHHLKDNIVEYEIVLNEEELLTRNNISKGELPLLILEDEPILILMNIKQGQIVKEISLCETCIVQVIYKRVI